MLGRSKVLLTVLSVIYGLLACPHSGKAQTSNTERTQSSAAVAPPVPTPSPTPDIFVRALYRHKPVLRYDSGERFFPIRVQAITNNVGNKLLRANGAEIAERRPGGAGLNIRYLRGINKGVYPNGYVIFDDDKLDEKGNDVDEYLRDANKYRDGPYGDRIYGRIVRRYDNDGQITGAWLQYWFFYYYNNFPGQVINAGDHEGDWEMIQIKVDAKGIPHVAVYAHHKQASKCLWDGLIRIGANDSRPVVFVARGSHASYPRTGARGTDHFVDGEQKRPVRGLIRIGSSTPQWLNWPGQWGSSDGSGFFGEPSPGGPKTQGDKWGDPEAFFASAEPDERCIAPPE
jgi:hypothetical protein